MQVPVIWPSYTAATSRHGSWDMGMLEDLFDGKLGVPAGGHEYVHANTFEEAGEVPGAVVVIPGQHHALYVDRLNLDLERFGWVLLVLLGDEESLFDISAVRHPRIKYWIQSRRTLLADQQHTNRFLPWGYPQGTREITSAGGLKGHNQWAFAGQVTHERRQACVNALSRMGDQRGWTDAGRFVSSGFLGGEIHPSPGFTLGLDRATYCRLLLDCKVAPCPAGVVTPDSFRVWEALEAGCVPIVDGMSPRSDVCPTQHWWNVLLGQEPGFPVIGDWSDAPALIERELRAWPESGNRVQLWWQRYKQELARRMEEDINALAE